MGSSRDHHPIHTFDIDDYLNRFVPRPRFYLLPVPISHWFGYRPPKGDYQPPSHPPSVLLSWLFSSIGAFIGISIIENIFRILPQLDGNHVPIVIASFGAAAILEYNAFESPLGQPRNLVLGQVLGASIGVGIAKLFLLLPEQRFTDLQWLAGALSVAAADAVMSMTKTVHPPAGATALLAATNKEILEIGWWLVALVLLAALLMLVSAMLVNNLYKRFPLYWWTPVDLTKSNQTQIVQVKDIEKDDVESDSSTQSSSNVDLTEDAQRYSVRQGSGLSTVAERVMKPVSSAEKERRNIHNNPETRISIDADRIVIPDWVQLSSWEAQVLEGFQKRLREQQID